VEHGRGMLTYGAIMLVLGIVTAILVGGTATDCSSTAGLLAQGASQSTATTCGTVQLIFYGGIGIGAIGALLVLCGTILRSRAPDPRMAPGYPREPGAPGMRTSHSAAAPGWYQDPAWPEFVRWWDGTMWTTTTRPGVGPPGTSPAGPPAGRAPPKRRR